MKKSLLILGLTTSVALFSGCAVSGTGPGMIFTANTTPVTATNASDVSKEGEATCTNILGIIAIGNCSVNKAAASAGIKEIKSVDTRNNGILGIFATTTTIVKGN